MNYTVDYFIDKFEKIPESNRRTHSFLYENQRCALGHCMSREAIYKTYAAFDNGETCFTPKASDMPLFYESKGLCLIFNEANPRKGSEIVIKINNGDDPRYQQPTPKQRILAALYDIKKLQEPKVKERIVYVSVPETIKQQAEELLIIKS